MAASATRDKLIFHAPLGAVEACKQAIFSTGADHYPNYSQCVTVVGDAQFLPGPAAQSNISKPEVLEKLQEAKVEALCVGKETKKKVVEALTKWVCPRVCRHATWGDMVADISGRAHPYEAPSYEVIKLEEF